MIKKSQKFLSKYMSKRKAYLIVYWTYFILTIIPMLLVGYLFDIIPFIIISTIIVNTTIQYTYAFHQSNGKCIYLTICLLIIFGYISKTAPSYLLFGVGLFCMRDIYLRSPLKSTIKGKDLKWHEDKIMMLLGIYLFLSIITLYFSLYIITNGILCSIIMIDLTLFVNKNEERV